MYKCKLIYILFYFIFLTYDCLWTFSCLLPAAPRAGGAGGDSSPRPPACLPPRRTGLGSARTPRVLPVRHGRLLRPPGSSGAGRIRPGWLGPGAPTQARSGVVTPLRDQPSPPRVWGAGAGQAPGKLLWGAMCGGSYSRSAAPGPPAARAPRLPCTYLLMGGCLRGDTPLYYLSPGVHGHYTAQPMM